MVLVYLAVVSMLLVNATMIKRVAEMDILKRLFVLPFKLRIKFALIILHIMTNVFVKALWFVAHLLKAVSAKVVMENMLPVSVLIILNLVIAAEPWTQRLVLSTVKQLIQVANLVAKHLVRVVIPIL